MRGVRPRGRANWCGLSLCLACLTVLIKLRNACRSAWEYRSQRKRARQGDSRGRLLLAEVVLRLAICTRKTLARAICSGPKRSASLLRDAGCATPCQNNTACPCTAFACTVLTVRLGPVLLRDTKAPLLYAALTAPRTLANSVTVTHYRCSRGPWRSCTASRYVAVLVSVHTCQLYTVSQVQSRTLISGRYALPPEAASAWNSILRPRKKSEN